MATQETNLARIGGKTISREEFIRRAEYAPRPAYCRGDDYVHKKIMLNSLIAEKLLALEAGEDNELTRKPEFLLYLQGRKEQAMRQWQYYQESYLKACFDFGETQTLFDHEVCAHVMHHKAETLFQPYLVMAKGAKTLEFFQETFLKVADFVGSHYFKALQEKRSLAGNLLWCKEDAENVLRQLDESPELILDEPLFRIDGHVWTVRDFEREIKIHPLVLRKNDLKRDDFTGQFKLAIMNMVRDRQLTQEAYWKGYDQVEAVQRNVEIWKDNLFFLYQQNRYLKTLGKQNSFEKKYLQIIEADLNPYVDRLQAKYDEEIEIDADLFQKIALTNRALDPTRRNEPFPVVVPSFPVVTTDPQLDYGRKMNQ
ncbi:MAG: hypothetical protein ACREOO_03235 [bacterium]